jgi:hypothetical protein
MSIERTTERRPSLRRSDINHEVVAAQSPRLLYSATLGNRSDGPRNPDGVAALLCVEGAMNSTGHNVAKQ